MASYGKPARSASKSPRGRSVGIALTAILSLGIVAGCGWGLASTISSMHEAARVMAEARTSLVTPLPKTTAAVIESRAERRGRVAKFMRFAQPSEIASRPSNLTPTAITAAYHRGVATRLALAEEKQKLARTKLLAAFALAKKTTEQAEATTVQPTLVTAYAESVSTRSIAPFGLVLAEPETEEEVAFPSQIPLPEARPLIETVVTDEAPADEKPVARKKIDGKDTKKDLAYAKPERSLFDGLFKSSKAKDGAWPGKGTKVAIYDVSSATVYMPDGTKLRAHSGIGKMRDNPRYEHVKMRGPTPAGIYRLSMREKRFYGVEAIRMTSIDGRHPKNRTGLLTHTNLLRGQTGSHGCVAFQNYQPFLKAFKRGHITMMVVVPELPSSKTQLAALYRKAGA